MFIWDFGVGVGLLLGFVLMFSADIFLWIFFRYVVWWAAGGGLKRWDYLYLTVCLLRDPCDNEGMRRSLAAGNAQRHQAESKRLLWILFGAFRRLGNLIGRH